LDCTPLFIPSFPPFLLGTVVDAGRQAGRMTGLQFLVASLATYRLTVLVSRDLGPFSIFKKLRAIPHLGLMVGCPYCVSIWIAAGVELSFYFSGVRDSPVVSACIVLAMSSITIACDRVFTFDHNP
jgi:hypothetical protein